VYFIASQQLAFRGCRTCRIECFDDRFLSDDKLIHRYCMARSVVSGNTRSYSVSMRTSFPRSWRSVDNDIRRLDSIKFDDQFRQTTSLTDSWRSTAVAAFFECFSDDFLLTLYYLLHCIA